MVWHKIRSKSNLRVDAYFQLLKMLLVCLLAGTGIRATTAAVLPPRLRRPVALAFTQNHQRLLVANSRG